MFYLGHSNKSQNDIGGRVEDKQADLDNTFFAIWLGELISSASILLIFKKVGAR